MNRALRFLIAACVGLAVALGVLFYRQVPRHQTPFKNAQRADAFELNQGTHTLHLVYTSSWVIQGMQPASLADADRVRGVLDDLASVQVEDEISDRADRASDFEVNEASGTRVVLSQKGNRLGEGVFGKQASDFQHIYFRFSGRPNVYLARGIMRGALDLSDPNAWRSHEITQVAEAEIVSLTVTSKQGTVALSRSSDTWTMGGKPVDPAPVFAALGVLAHLRADGFIDPPPSPAFDAGALSFQTAHGTTRLTFGALDSRTRRYPVAVDGSTGGFWIAESKGKQLLLKPSDIHVHN